MANIEHKMIAHLSEKWNRDNICPLCGSNEWVISPKILELREFHDGNLVIEGPTYIYPVIPVSCKNCGNVLLISATISGMMPNNKNVK